MPVARRAYGYVSSRRRWKGLDGCRRSTRSQRYDVPQSEKHVCPSPAGRTGTYQAVGGGKVFIGGRCSTRLQRSDVRQSGKHVWKTACTIFPPPRRPPRTCAPRRRQARRGCPSPAGRSGTYQAVGGGKVLIGGRRSTRLQRSNVRQSGKHVWKRCVQFFPRPAGRPLPARLASGRRDAGARRPQGVQVSFVWRAVR